MAAFKALILSLPRSQLWIELEKGCFWSPPWLQMGLDWLPILGPVLYNLSEKDGFGRLWGGGRKLNPDVIAVNSKESWLWPGFPEMNLRSKSKVLMGFNGSFDVLLAHSINVVYACTGPPHPILNGISYSFKYINQSCAGKTDPSDSAINMNYHLSNMHNGLKKHNSRCSLND